ncbi:hypothetical protein Sta7437_3722 [Stanieria cyanosphaera PCC 7437]|uniref:Uncharacterized protein n=1 Tax=Stanieria cyanosphaera (strain ATCC 29371 / PCC 7437) TaxID=111780 RepID=K9XXG8_STAC7|nr:COP23 domain-containing protein [Stanieria cyanosphaera]AFZ37218.1 hypothetical protein Sta7437_3722 [Stanieria cyanosphaera PCC 7437]
MSIKNLSPILAAGAIALSAIPAFGESTQSSNRNVFCQVNNGIPTTVANVQGEIKSIFHWRNEVLPKSANAQQLCNSVSAKLANYSSLKGFGGHDQGGLPTICAENSPGECSLVLFTLAPTDNAIDESERVLAGILDSGLAKDKQVSNARGIQSTYYPVDFWYLLGLKFNK